MGLVSLVCPSCNGVLELDDNRKEYFCQFCGSKVVLEEKKIEINGNISLDGALAADNLIERGFQYLEDRDFVNAKSSFNRALDINARKWKAFVGLLLCDLNYTDIPMLSTNTCPLTEYDDFKKALRYATGDDKAMLEELNEHTVKNSEKVQERVQQTLDELNEEKRELKSKHEKLSKKLETYMKLKKSFKPIMIISWIVTAIVCIVEIAEASGAQFDGETSTIFFTIFFLLSIAVTVCSYIFDGTSKGIQDDIDENLQKQGDVLSSMVTIKAEYKYMKFKEL